jgi:N-acetylglucosaminyldiphosphoundecaprenol N-acetyl-beta-D-mannosaminyltransferase
MNNDWMNPAADAIDMAGPQSPNAPGHEKTLRLMDLGLAGIASALLIAMLPLLLWAWLSGELQGSRRLGAGRRPFTLRSWRFADNANGRLLTRLGARSWPALIHILRGEMAWVGPRPRRIEEPTGPAAHLRPGLTGLHQLRRATSVDFATEDASEAAYVAERSVSNDLRLLVLSSWNGVGRRSMAAKAEAPAQVKILDTTVDNLSMDGTLQRVMSLVESGTHAKVGFVNPACANIAAGSHTYRRDLAALDLVLPDGIGMKIAADWLGTPIRQNVNGTDFFPRLCNAMNERGQRLYLVGARPEVVARVAEVVGERWPQIELVGAQHGYFNRAEEASIAQDIQESGAHVVLVAMGVPTQENFIARLGDRMGPCVVIGVGGLFDFVAGRVSRAPQWMRDAGLEWIWRLIQEPGRMWQRYLVGNFSFLGRVAMQRAGWRKGQTTKARTLPMPATQSKQSAVLLATHLVGIGSETRLAASLPFGPASFAETVVAQLASQSVGHIHVLLSPNAAPHTELQQQLGDGRRWGVQIHWHQSARKDAPFQPLRAMADGQTKPLLLINAHTWLNTEGLARVLREPQMVVRTNSACQTAWQGWACVTPGQLNALSHCSDAETLEAALTERMPTRYIAMHNECASAHSQAAWLGAQTAVPAKALVALQTEVWTAHPWGYASAQAHISPDAHIEGPVWIGPGCVVRADAHLGPHVTLTSNVVVDKHAVLANAVALPEAFVGAQAKVADGVFVAELHTANDPFELALPPAKAKASAAPAGRLSRFLGFSLAALLAPVVWPLMGMRKLLGRPAAWASQRVVLGRTHLGARLLTVTLRQPVTARSRAEHLLAWYGAVLDLAQGHRQWVGIRARRVDQWFSLDADTREALNFAPIGLWHPVAWTNRLDCVLDSEAVADRMWQASQRRSPAASRAGSGKPRLRWTTGLMSYRALTAT